ncbi:MAG: FKBP-type peptidyl-prolyl cis-trans isomerase [Candidatus Omnitrophota bacterium]
MELQKDVKLIDEIIGDGVAIEQGEYHLLAIRISLNKGEVVKEPKRCVGYTLDRDVLSNLSHSKENTKVDNEGYYSFCVRIDRENFKGGYLYAMKGMKVGGYRKVVIGPHLAHRAEGVPGVIPPNAKITIEIKIIR